MFGLSKKVSENEVTMLNILIGLARLSNIDPIQLARETINFEDNAVYMEQVALEQKKATKRLLETLKG